VFCCGFFPPGSHSPVQFSPRERELHLEEHLDRCPGRTAYQTVKRTRDRLPQERAHYNPTRKPPTRVRVPALRERRVHICM